MELSEIKQFIDDFIRPRVQADGGELVLASAEGNVVHLVLMGECAVCAAQCGLRAWATAQLRARFGEHLQVSFSVKKRYFQDM